MLRYPLALVLATLALTAMAQSAPPLSGAIFTTTQNGTVVNGASIPQVFWTSFGPPFVGDYRRASVVHDHYCDTRTETEQATHRMFHHACRTGGVGTLQASMMYAAVKTFGPHWKGTSISELPGVQAVTVPQIRAASEAEYQELEKWIEEANPSLDEIDQRIEQLGPLVDIPVS